MKSPRIYNGHVFRVEEDHAWFSGSCLWSVPAGPVILESWSGGIATPRELHRLGPASGFVIGPIVRRAFLGIVSVMVVLLTLPSCSPKRRSPQTMTRNIMGTVSVGLQLYYCDHGDLPKGSSGEIFRALFGEIPYAQDAEGNMLDGWDNAIHITITGEGKGYAIRSSGPNRRDDGGQGDDMEKVYVLGESSGKWKEEGRSR